MSWHDRLRAASFRGVPFHVEGDGLTVGRRTQVHEYPQRDQPYVEDLGRSLRRISVTAFLIGTDYMTARDRLLGAIEEPGPGTLVHPWYGQMQVMVEGECRISHSRDDGGVCQVSLSFVEAGDLSFPSSKADTPSLVRLAGGSTKVAALNDFAQSFNIAHVPDWVKDSAGEDLKNIGHRLGKVLKINTPTFAATSDVGSALWEAVEGSNAPMSSLLQVAQTSYTLSSQPRNTAMRRQQAANTGALSTVTQRAALVAASVASAARAWPVHDDAVKTRDTIAQALDAAAQAATSDSSFQALYDLRSAVVTDINSRAVPSVRLREKRPLSSIPLDVMSYELYEDAERSNEIALRNSIRNPSWTAPGHPLKVLNR